MNNIAARSGQDPFDGMFDDLLGSGTSNVIPLHSALDAPIAITRFSNVNATRFTTEPMSLRTLSGVIRRKRAESKKALPLLKLATLGDKRTEKGALRHDANLVQITGIEGDYDDGKVTPQEAARMLKAANVAALVYTTPRHKPEAPRWRVLVPLSAPVSPAERDTLCARLNGALGGILGDESFTRSQSFYFGGIGCDPEVHLVEGRAVDRASDVVAIGKRKATAVAQGREAFDDILGSDPGPRQDVDWDKVRRALDVIPASVPYPVWGKVVGFALEHAGQGDSEAFKLFDEWSQTCPDSYPGKGKMRSLWDSFTRSRQSQEQRGQSVTTVGSLFAEAEQYGFDHLPPQDFDNLDGFEDQPEEPAVKDSKRSRLTFLSPSECDAAPARSYLIKGLIAEGDVGCIFGAPGAGKSLLAPFLAYAVAQGREAFGMRSKAGGVFYVAAEDPHGMRGRVKALRIAHDDAPNFHLVEGVSNLLAAESPDLAALVTAVKERLPKLIILDTLAMSFPGLEENSAEAMGRVVAVSRKLTQWGAAVLLIHHDTKAEGNTPRGHSLLNGALDVALHVKRDESGIIRGKLTKNRNGTCDRDLAFRIAIENGGTDEDGDAITLPRCDELDASSAPQAVKLSAPERAVLDTIGLAGGEVAEADLRKLCIDGRKVSSSDKQDSRRRVTDRALKQLVEKGSVIFEDGMYRIWSDHADDFDDLGEPDNPDSVRTKPGLSEMAMRRTPDGLGHIPLGVSDCPDDAGKGVLV